MLLNILKLLINLSLQKTDLTRFFIIKPRHPGRLKKQMRMEKASVGALATHGKTPTTVTWNERLKIYCRVIVTQ